MTKRMMAAAGCLCLTLSMSTAFMGENASDITDIVIPENVSEMSVIYSYASDLSIYDSSFDEYFEGSAEEGVTELLNAGRVYINGMPLPTEPGSYSMNGSYAIQETENGTWNYGQFPWLGLSNNEVDTFEEARSIFVQGVTTGRGVRTALLSEEGKDTADAIVISHIDSGLVLNITENNDSTTVDFLSSSITAENAMYDDSIEIGDIVIYWEAPDGMHIERAIAENSVYHYVIGDPSDDAALMDLIDGEEFVDARMGRDIQTGSRPNQFAQVLERFDIQDNEVIGWWTPSHYLIGVTRSTESAWATLEMAVANAAAGTEGIVVSEDGSDVAADVYWVTEDIWTVYEDAYRRAVEMLDSEDASATEINQMLSELADAYGSEFALDDHMSGTKGIQGNKAVGTGE